MKIRRPFFTSGALSLWVAIAASAAGLASSTANAQTTIAASTTISTSTSSTTTTTATTAAVLVGGIVSGVPESVAFGGLAQVSANVVTDPDFGNPPVVVLSIDLSKVAGVGLSTRQQYFTSNQEILTRALTAVDTVQFTFPFSQSGTSAVSSPLVGLVSFNLSFNVNTLTLTGIAADVR